MANLLKPYNFGIDRLSIARNECNDATWMKNRYKKGRKLTRELMFILNSTFLVNLLEDISTKRG